MDAADACRAKQRAKCAAEKRDPCPPASPPCPVDPHGIDPGIREYTRMIVLPAPRMAGGRLRHVLAMGKAGRVLLVSTDAGVAAADAGEPIYDVAPGELLPCLNRALEAKSRVASAQSADTTALQVWRVWEDGVNSGVTHSVA